MIARTDRSLLARGVHNTVGLLAFIGLALGTASVAQEEDRNPGPCVGTVHPDACDDSSGGGGDQQGDGENPENREQNRETFRVTNLGYQTLPPRLILRFNRRINSEELQRRLVVTPRGQRRLQDIEVVDTTWSPRTQQSIVTLRVPAWSSDSYRISLHSVHSVPAQGGPQRELLDGNRNGRPGGRYMAVLDIQRTQFQQRRSFGSASGGYRGGRGNGGNNDGDPWASSYHTQNFYVKPSNAEGQGGRIYNRLDAGVYMLKHRASVINHRLDVRNGKARGHFELMGVDIFPSFSKKRYSKQIDLEPTFPIASISLFGLLNMKASVGMYLNLNLEAEVEGALLHAGGDFRAGIIGSIDTSVLAGIGSVTFELHMLEPHLNSDAWASPQGIYGNAIFTMTPLRFRIKAKAFYLFDEYNEVLVDKSVDPYEKVLFSALPENEDRRLLPIRLPNLKPKLTRPQLPFQYVPFQR
ncbi:MAG: hypothetical protein QF752_06360 [Planctomycetota bacterium]|nr:hypothetical protein [Planctomycetota bacterium]